jgi:hypothetical protein
MVPEGSDDVLMVNAVGVTGVVPTDRLIVAVADCGEELESTTETTKE